MNIRTFSSNRLVKNEDLNHHGTLYAGRSAEWFVEAGFIAAASHTRPENIVCLKIHGMTFTRPVKAGEIVNLASRVVLAGRSSLHTHVNMNVEGEAVMEGFITFVNVDNDGRTFPHGITVQPSSPEEFVIQDRIRKLLERPAVSD
jgi:acyl-CoA hydrolase